MMSTPYWLNFRRVAGVLMTTGIGLLVLSLAACAQAGAAAKANPSSESNVKTDESGEEKLVTSCGQIGIAGPSLESAERSAGPIVRTEGQPGEMFSTRVDGPPTAGAVTRFGGHGGAPDHVISVAARAIGISEEQVRSAWAEQPLGDVARAHGVEPEAIGDALKTDEHGRLLREAAAGRIEPRQVDEIRGFYAQIVDRWLTQRLSALAC